MHNHNSRGRGGISGGWEWREGGREEQSGCGPEPEPAVPRRDAMLCPLHTGGCRSRGPLPPRFFQNNSVFRQFWAHPGPLTKILDLSLLHIVQLSFFHQMLVWLGIFQLSCVTQDFRTHFSVASRLGGVRGIVPPKGGLGAFLALLDSHGVFSSGICSCTGVKEKETKCLLLWTVFRNCSSVPWSLSRNPELPKLFVNLQKKIHDVTHLVFNLPPPAIPLQQSGFSQRMSDVSGRI